MKLLKMKNEKGELTYMVKLETMFERVVYDLATDYNDETFKVFDNAMYCELNVNDREVKYYFNVDGKEQEPSVGDTFELDDMKWERIV